MIMHAITMRTQFVNALSTRIYRGSVNKMNTLRKDISRQILQDWKKAENKLKFSALKFKKFWDNAMQFLYIFMLLWMSSQIRLA